ncbi:hydrogenase maturation nickel metallochaperone HypA [candidate division KSB1 bacterium]
MHELTIARDIYKTVCEVADNGNFGRVRAIHLEIGVLAAVNAECLRFTFELIVEGTRLNGAELITSEVPLKLKCGDCGCTGISRSLNYTCPGCGSRYFEIIDGKHIYIKSVEVDNNGDNNA